MPDEVFAEMDRTLRVALQTAGQVAERVARANAERARVVAQRMRESAAQDAAVRRSEQLEVQRLMTAQRDAARTYTASLTSYRDFGHASEEHIAQGWSHALAWKDCDPVMAANAERIAENVERRFGFRPEVPADPRGHDEAAALRALFDDAKAADARARDAEEVAAKERQDVADIQAQASSRGDRETVQDRTREEIEAEAADRLADAQRDAAVRARTRVPASDQAPAKDAAPGFPHSTQDALSRAQRSNVRLSASRPKHRAAQTERTHER